MKLSHILFTQGFGTRRECAALVQSGWVSHQGQTCTNPDAAFNPEGLTLSVRGQDWPCYPKALLMMHKPAGVECSQKPRHHPSVYSLLPLPLRNRGVQSIGRLDEDTTGLLLFTDDGSLIHRLTSPKHHVPKVYEAGCKHPVSEAQVQQLKNGVKLVDENTTVCAADAQATGLRADGLHGLRLTLMEGKYHQVKRMVAAVSNRVEALHRSAFANLSLPADLKPGQWCWLQDASALLTARPTHWPSPEQEP
jgi:16S rRNA pseudouridine516 synthase